MHFDSVTRQGPHIALVSHMSKSTNYLYARHYIRCYIYSASCKMMMGFKLLCNRWEGASFCFIP